MAELRAPVTRFPAPVPPTRPEYLRDVIAGSDIGVVQKPLTVFQRLAMLRQRSDDEEYEHNFPAEPEENLLYFVEKHAPLLDPWQRELARIVRKLAQYFYPQRQTQVMNEGWATFWHYTILQTMYDDGLLADSFMLEVLHSHTSVLTQPKFDSPYFSGINPYALGFAMFRDIRRMCEDPTEEDYRWFPDVAGTDWLKTLDYAMRNFKDESFISQFLSPKMIRDFRLFCLVDDDKDPNMRVGAIHDDAGYRFVREMLSRQYSISERDPNIQVTHVDMSGDRSLTLQHFTSDRKPLAQEYKDVMKHLAWLWGFKVKLDSVSEDGSVRTLHEVTLDLRKRRPDGRQIAAMRRT